MNYFVSIKINLTSFFLGLIIQKHFYFETKLVRLNLIYTREFMNRVYRRKQRKGRNSTENASGKRHFPYHPGYICSKTSFSIHIFLSRTLWFRVIGARYRIVPLCFTQISFAETKKWANKRLIF